MEGYVDLGLFDEAFNVLRRLSSELGLTNNVVELFAHVLTKTDDSIGDARISEALRGGEPPVADPMLLVAHLRYRAGDFSTALDWLRCVEPLCIGTAEFHYLSAQCHAGLGDFEQATRSLQRVAFMTESLRTLSAP